MIITDQNFIFETAARAVPKRNEVSVVRWAVDNVKIVGSARATEDYNPAVAPWQCEPIERANDGTKKCTVIKPVQTGGTTIGEIVILFWIAFWSSGNICYYWQNDKAAQRRFISYFNKKLKACKAVMERAPVDKNLWSKGSIVFPHCNFVMQGVKTDRNVASDNFRGIVNEELHDVQGGWDDGRLQQVYARQTAYWNSIVYNISNASFEGDQLHKEWLNGTQQYWEVKCLHCGQFHRMRTLWEDEHPELGGLRYDATGCRLPNGDYDYNRLAPTIFYQMGCCGHHVTTDSERRALSSSGRYSEPTNPAASLLERSYTYQAVAVDFIPFIELIKAKHRALLARKKGDPKPWADYLRERECKFISDKDLRRPVERTEIILSKEQKKNRAGMVNRLVRLAAVDWQRGSQTEGELKHFWLVVQDWDADGNSQIVWEGKCVDEQDLTGRISEHEVDPTLVIVDSSFDSENVYAFCLNNGYSCFKVDGTKDGTVKYYAGHKDNSQRVYSSPQFLHIMRGHPASRPDWHSEPRYFHISKWGAMEKLEYVRSNKETKYIVPDDVSEDFKEHFKSWQLTPVRNSNNELEYKWKMIHDDDHLYQCCAYLVVWADIYGVFNPVTPPAADEEESQTE